jgi:hypothetical protein
MIARPRSIAAAVALVALPAGAGLALAQNDGRDDGRPRTDPVRARAVLTEDDTKFRTCQGKDGAYIEAKSKVRGTATGDPRLRGAIKAKVRDFFNLDTGDGTFRGRFVVRDARTGRVKVVAKLLGVDHRVEGGDEIAGLIRGEARRNKARNLPGGELVANFRLKFPEDPPGPPVVQIGGSWTNSLIPAVIQKGRCTGPFQPAPEAASASARGGAGARWGIAG